MTNSRSLSWIDRGRWEVLLAAATRGAPLPGVPARPSSPAPTPRLPPRHAAATAMTAPAPPAAVKAVPSYKPFFSESSQLDVRLQALVDWIEVSVTCRAAFIADDNGLPVVEHLGAEQGHIAAASSILLMLASVRSLMCDSGGWLSMKMSSAACCMW
jgi:hypothetical protein